MTYFKTLIFALILTMSSLTLANQSAVGVECSENGPQCAQLKELEKHSGRSPDSIPGDVSIQKSLWDTVESTELEMQNYLDATSETY